MNLIFCDWLAADRQFVFGWLYENKKFQNWKQDNFLMFIPLLDTNIDLLLNKDEVSDSGWHDILSNGPRMQILGLDHFPIKVLKSGNRIWNWASSTDHTYHCLQNGIFAIWNFSKEGIWYELEQCCNEDWKWTKDEYEDSLVSENGPKTNTKNLC